MTTSGNYVHPEISPEAKPFWDAANEGRLVIHTCKDCGRGHHYPRYMCPHCYSENMEWKESDGIGTIYSFSVVTTGKDTPPYVIAYVEIADRVKAMTNIIECDPATLKIGQKVASVFRPSRNGQNILLFTPV